MHGGSAEHFIGAYCDVVLDVIIVGDLVSITKTPTV